MHSARRNDRRAALPVPIHVCPCCPGGQVHPVWPVTGFGPQKSSAGSSILLSAHPPALHRPALSEAQLLPEQISYPGGGHAAGHLQKIR